MHLVLSLSFEREPLQMTHFVLGSSIIYNRFAYAYSQVSNQSPHSQSGQCSFTPEEIFGP